MAKTVYIKTALTGGTLDALDGIDGANLLDGDVAYVYVNGIKYEYVLDDDSGAAEDSPNVIAPDTNAGDKRWILQGATFESVTLQSIPTTDSHAATKEYVDSAVAAATWTFFLTDDSADVSGYYYLKDEETGETLSELTSPTLSAGDDQLLWSFVTESGDPGIDLLSLGVYTATMFLHKSGNKDVNIYWKLFKRDSGDVETELMTSGISDDLTDSRSQYILSSYINSDVALDTTDRIVLKLYANVSGTGTDPTVTISMENNYDSRIALRVGTSAFANIFVKKSGDTITGDLDIQGNLTSSAIDNTPIGQTTPAAGAFTTITGSDDMNIGSGVFFVNVSTSKVGIKTADPAYSLDVGGSFRVGTDVAHKIIITNGEIFHYYSSETNPRAQFDRDFPSSGMDGWFFGDPSDTIDATGVGIARTGTRKLGLFTSDGTTRQERFTIDSNGNIGFNSTTFGTSLAKGIAMALGTAPTGTVADAIQMVVQDYAAGDARLYIYGEASLDPVIIGNGVVIANSASFTNFQRGTGTFNGPTGVTVSIDDVGTTDYQVVIQPLSQSGFIGEISVESKAANSFVVKNSGSDTTTQFDWILNAAIV